MELNRKINTIAIVSLSAGTIGEGFVKHELDIGVKRLREYGLDVRFMPHALKGIKYVKEHPQDRAADLIQAFADPDIDMIFCAIGGDDTYRLLPYLFDNVKLAKVACDKVFLGFSDTTINHFMLHKLGINSFYGQSFLADVCELDSQMLPYTKHYLEELIQTGTVTEIRPSEEWYEGRQHFGVDQIGTPLKSHPNAGFELLQGCPVFAGKILGGCIDSIHDMFVGDRYSDMPLLCAQYDLFPSLNDWKGKILLLESSEEKMSPTEYRKTLMLLKQKGLFDVVSGVLIGKPMDGVYEQEYKEALKEIIDNDRMPVVCNVNVGHALPRCIIPFGVDATVDVTEQVIRFKA